MVFTSNLFLFIFLPIFLGCYYLTPFRARSALILVFSYVFYGWWRPDFALLLLGVTVGTYVLTMAMENPKAKSHRIHFLWAGIIGNLGALAYFKYFNFGVDSLNALLALGSIGPIEYTKVVLPIGLSFFVFQAISYQIDVYRGDAPVTENLFDFAAFISFFPQLVAGPVLRYQPLADQFRHRDHSWSVFGQGSMIFMMGFCGKVLVADPMAPLVDAAFAVQNPSFLDAWLGTLAYTVQLFFDFSGYSTMAIGLGLMVGFIFPQNFDDPYTSASITEFWRRWHMSLSSWLRAYLYVPLGGNRLGSRRTYINLLLTMLLGGLWHGANWTFVVWGAWHGGILAIERWCKERNLSLGLPRPFMVAWTLLLVMIGWVFFRASSLGQATKILSAMAGQSDFALSPELAWQISPDQIVMLVFAYALVYALPYLRRISKGRMTILIIPFFAWAVATLSAQAFTPFLYFQF